MNNFGTYSGFVDPAKVHVLVVPIGNWEREDFKSSIDIMKKYNELRLLDISPIDSLLFTPQGFPNGRIFLNYKTSTFTNEADLFLYDFEPFRKIFIVIGLVNDDSDPLDNYKKLKELYPDIISHNLMYTNTDRTDLKETLVGDKKNDEDIGSKLFLCNLANNVEHNNNIQTVICDIAKNFLKSLDHYYSSYKHVTLRSPGAIGGSKILKTTLSPSLLNSGTSKSSQTSKASSHSKRLSTFEMTSNIKRSASLQLARSLATSDNKAQQKSQGRQLKILGNFQLLSGRYSDALNSFTEAIILLHVVRDYLWLGSALDGIAICFLLLKYLDISFKIPSVITELCPIEKLEPTNESVTNLLRKSTSSQSNVLSPRNSINSSVPPLEILNSEIILPYLIKSISDKALYYYDSSLAHNSEYVPQNVYCELLLKTTTFMVVCKNDIEISKFSMKKIINYNYSEIGIIDRTSEKIVFANEEIYYFISNIFELQVKDMEMYSQKDIYFTLAEIYGALGYYKKKTFVLRLLLVALAATSDKGIWQPSYHALLLKMVDLYNISSINPESSIVDASKTTWVTFQKKALILLIKVADKVHDKECLATFSLLLFTRFSHLMTQNEQKMHLLTYIQPLVTNSYISNYWDPFLLRDLTLEIDNNASAEVEQRLLSLKDNVMSSELAELSLSNGDLEEKKVFNPFKIRTLSNLTSTSEVKVQKPKIAQVGDNAFLKVKLQNPFKFEVYVTSFEMKEETKKYIKLDNDSVDANHPLIIQPESFIEISFPVSFISQTSSHNLVIDSLLISVFDMKPTPFNVIKKDSQLHCKEDNSNSIRGCKSSFEVQILPELPELEIKKTSKMINNQWMILEGSSDFFKLEIGNRSLRSNIDYISLSYRTNIEASIKSNYWKNMKKDDLFDYETRLEWLKNDLIKFYYYPASLLANEKSEIKFEVNSGLEFLEFLKFDIDIEYGMKSDDGQWLYIKTISIPHQLTIKKSIEIPGIDMMQLTDTFSDATYTVDWISYINEQLKRDRTSKITDYIILLLDVRNSWVDAAEVNFSFESYSSTPFIIESGHTSRVIIPIKKLGVKKHLFSNKPVPKVHKWRQFIQTGMTEDEKIRMREKFWCREYILENLKCDWVLQNGTYSGDVKFRPYIEKFSDSFMSLFYNESLEYNIDMSIDTKDINNMTAGQPFDLIVLLKRSKFSQNDSQESFRMNYMIYDINGNRHTLVADNRILSNGNMYTIFHIINSLECKLNFIPIESGKYLIEVNLCPSETSDQNIKLASQSISFEIK
ncbi:hypothetical protein TPHA_0E02060 [Tetrapisispora phaffii CBS 4417]|uniref:Uncharacterized protein n=1 Tax=Tetrapisispora phaffii (strain ATCC 24235 / CBS 4417 / NBRC 1672 / NRRL Y-8282 / UCD 70-5) TaxID=1071381 RepID=G8BTS0_TETPH|nr:hypothetical protein TPHA_0E02060 [Tetrapisispora phaffii CBS 4417]CCE63298.1 hypothetical protein TPHA_0E02060 [Tetrapisispora phaffii CBS 4417]